jgi:hypothetical protein
MRLPLRAKEAFARMAQRLLIVRVTETAVSAEEYVAEHHPSLLTRQPRRRRSDRATTWERLCATFCFR